MSQKVLDVMKSIVVLSVFLVPRVLSLGLDLEYSEDKQNFLQEDDADRAIILTTGLNLQNLLGLNLTNLASLLTLGAAAFVPLIGGLALAAIILAGIATKDFKNFDHGYGGGYASSYSEYSRALGLDAIDWEKLSLTEWMSMGEEIMRKFDPSNLECQKRVICELHQNTQHFGFLARKMVDLFGYLRYAEILNLPQIVKTAVGEYMDAADRGRSLTKDCGDIYTDCDFSVKSLYDRYSGNLV